MPVDLVWVQVYVYSLFLSLQEVLKREPLQKKDHQELRKFLLEVLINNRKMYGLDKQPKSLKYLKTISMSGREPIPEVLLAASDEFNLKIWLHHGTCCSVVYMGPKARKREDLKNIHIQVLGGTHFNPLRDNGTFQMNKDDTIVDELAIEDQEVPSEEENEGFMDSEESEAENLLEHPPEEGLGVNLLMKERGCLLYTSDAADERSSVDLGG